MERFITEDLCRLNVTNLYITNERIIVIVKVDYRRTLCIKEIFISLSWTITEMVQNDKWKGVT